MELSTAATINKVLAILGIIGSVFVMLAGILVLAFGPVVMSTFAGSEEAAGIALVGSILSVVGAFLLILGAVCIWVDISLMKQKNWARIVVIILSALGVLGAVGSLVMGDVFAIFSLAINAFIIWFYAFNPTVKQLFSGGAIPPAN